METVKQLGRRASVSADGTVASTPKTPRERILLALELGRRGRDLQKRAARGRLTSTGAR
jgi:hypothetical protein